ncbi:MAG TPA: hypothetical protein EYH05_01660, partial [Anaerolineae bacterium]|nr:hypothetical protein [Anaerolineae bacterium]
MTEQPSLLNDMPAATLIDQTHAAERRVFEVALEKEGIPFADVYASLIDDGWYWREAAVIAWLSMPRDKRLPKTQYDLARILGCSDQIITKIKRKASTQAAMMRLTTASLFAHKAQVDAALIESASDPDYKHNQDRKTFYTLIGALEEKHEL